MNNDLISREALKATIIEPLNVNDAGKNDWYDGYYTAKNEDVYYIDKAPTVFAYTEDDMCQATVDGYDVAKRQYEFNIENFKKFVESRVDMQDLYLPIHFFDLLDEYCSTDMRGGKE